MKHSEKRQDSDAESVVSTVSSCSTVDDIASESRHRRRSSQVRFSTIEFQEYPICPGDGVPGAGGPALSMNWKPENVTPRLSVDEYERERQPRRVKHEMLVPQDERISRLMDAGYSFREISQCSKSSDVVRQSRQKSAQNRKYDRVDELAEKAGRSFHKLTRKMRALVPSTA